MDFKRTQGLKKDSDFRKVYKHGKSFANRNLVMYILDNKSDSTRVGISVSKKVGNAINRNKIRRRIKESYRLNIDANVKYGYYILKEINRYLSKLLIYLVRFYQKFISPLKGPTCRFYPTCSQYSIEAIRKYGALKGIYLTIRRLLKCHPFHPGGYDPLK